MKNWKAVVISCLAMSSFWAGSALAQDVEPPDDAFGRPPPGTAADQALWRAGREVDNAIPMSRGEAAKLQWRVKQGQFNERLELLEKQGPPEKAMRARKAGEQVIAARDRNYEIMSRRWPVDPTRVCSYPLLDFSSALLAGGNTPADLSLQDETRKRLKECVDKARVILGSIEGSNKELAGALAALESELPPGLPAAGPAAAPMPATPAGPQGPLPAAPRTEAK